MTACAEGLRLENAWQKCDDLYQRYKTLSLHHQRGQAWARWQAHRDGCAVCKEVKDGSI